MNYRTLGKTQLRVSEIGLGALEIGRDWPYWREADEGFSRPEESSAIRIVHEAIDLGINFMDTAPAYFQSEAILGKALKGKRQQVILATKCGEWFDGQNSVYDYSANATEKFIENSLKQLQTDYVDLLQIHSGNVDVVRRGETLEAMKKSQKEGKARFIGISLDSEDAAHAALDDGGYDCIQVSYNLLRREMEKTVFPKAVECRVGVIIKDGLGAGRLSSKHEQLPENQLKESIRKANRLASEVGLTLTEFCLRFVLGNQSTSTVIVGTKNIEHLRANTASCGDPEKTGMVRKKAAELSPPQ